MLLPFNGRDGGEWGEEQPGLESFQPPQAALQGKEGAVPRPVFTAKIKGHFLHRPPGVEAAEVSKATISQTTSPNVV